MTRRRPSRLRRALLAGPPLLAALLALAFALTRPPLQSLLTGEAAEEEEAEGRHPSRATPAANAPGEIRLDPAGLAANGIRLLTLSPVLLAPERTLTARVLDPEPLIAAREALRSRAARLSAARTRRAGAETALARNRALYRDHQNVAAATLEEAETAAAEARAAEAEAEAAASALTAQTRARWGEALAHELEAGGPLAEALLSGRERLVALSWTAGEPPPSPLPEARLIPAPGAPPLPLLPIGPAPAADPATARQDLYYHAAATPALLPGLNATASLPVGRAEPVFAIPRSAVVWWQGRAYVYRALGEGRFARLALDGAGSAEGEVLLPARDLSRLSIVSEGGMVLLSEEFRGSIDLGEDEGDDP